MGLSEQIGKRFPFARWSVLRMAMGMPRLLKSWQVGDGREAALQKYVLANARRGDLEDAIRVVDHFAYTRSFLINVGDEKGAILDAAITRARPKRLLELGTYCGYSALRTVRAMPDDAHLYSIEFNSGSTDLNASGEKPGAWFNGIRLEGDRNNPTVSTKRSPKDTRKGAVPRLSLADYRQMLVRDFNYNSAITTFQQLGGLPVFTEALLQRHPTGDRRTLQVVAREVWSYATTGMDTRGVTDIHEMQGYLYVFDPEIQLSSDANTEEAPSIPTSPSGRRGPRCRAVRAPTARSSSHRHEPPDPRTGQCRVASSRGVMPTAAAGKEA